MNTETKTQALQVTGTAQVSELHGKRFRVHFSSMNDFVNIDIPDELYEQVRSDRLPSLDYAPCDSLVGELGSLALWVVAFSLELALLAVSFFKPLLGLLWTAMLLAGALYLWLLLVTQ